MLQHAHSGLRWVVLVLLVWTVINAFRGKTQAGGANWPLYTMISVHIQLLIGLLLYAQSPYVKFSADTMKDPFLRFYTVEHLAGMLVAIILITLGYRKIKTHIATERANKEVLIYYGIALLLIILSIPWPFRELGGGWF